MRKQRKKYDRPLKPWNKERIEKERKILNEYGLRRKSELWKAESVLRGFRRTARKLEAKKSEQRENELLGKLIKIGLLSGEAKIDDVLALEVRNLLDRRLQTILYKKGMANTMKQARQFIVHGHISVNGRRAVWPSIIVNSEHNDLITFHDKSNVKDQFLKKAKNVKNEGKSDKL